jgi:hypothetical protein
MMKNKHESLNFVDPSAINYQNPHEAKIKQRVDQKTKEKIPMEPHEEKGITHYKVLKS